MFLACIGHVSYGVLSWIPLHSIMADIGDNEYPVPHQQSVITSCIALS
jgi:hypothetical protein